MIERSFAVWVCAILLLLAAMAMSFVGSWSTLPPASPEDRARQEAAVAEVQAEWAGWLETEVASGE